MLSAYKHLRKPVNINGGLSETVLLAPVSWFEKIATTNGRQQLSLNNATSIFENHKFKVGKGFIEMQCAPFKSGINANIEGKPGTGTFKNILNVQLNGSYAQLHGTISTLMQEPLIVLVKDVDCGQTIYYQLGNDSQYAWMVPGFQASSTKGSIKSYAVSFESIQHSVYQYFGQVELLPNIQLLNFRIVHGNKLIAIGSTEDIANVDLSFEITTDMILRMHGIPPAGYSFSLNSDGALIVNTPY